MRYTDFITMKPLSRVTNYESRITTGITKFLVGGVAVILVLVPFHAFLAVWVASLAGHYTLVRLWKELLLLSLLAAAAWLVSRDKKLRRITLDSWLFRLVFAFVALQLLLGAAAYAKHAVSFPALAEGLIDGTRPMAILFLAWLAAVKSPWLQAHWQKMLLIPAAIVVTIGLLQTFVLPAGFLAHFGYSQTTIPPYNTVDQNRNFVRVQSTLRGANPLGAYLVIVMAALTAMVTSRLQRGKILGAGLTKLLAFSGVTLVVLFFTYSRSAYLGTAIAVLGIVFSGVKSKRLRRWLLVTFAVCCVAGSGSVLVLRHNTRFEDTFFHTSQLSTSAQSSNQNRASALESGVRDILHEPLGRGPGTAGPASVHNSHPARIAENYFLQIGQETGWLGLGLFMVINLLLARELWRRTGTDRLPTMLLASLAGLTLVNLLSHAWADDTLAYVWWGLAGIALGA